MPYNTETNIVNAPLSLIIADLEQRSDAIYSDNNPNTNFSLANGLAHTLSDIPGISVKIGGKDLGSFGDIRGDKIYFRSSLPNNPGDDAPCYWLIDNTANNKSPQWQLFFTDKQSNACREIPISFIPDLNNLVNEKNLISIDRDAIKQCVLNATSLPEQKNQLILKLLLEAITTELHPNDNAAKASLFAETLTQINNILSGQPYQLSDAARLVINLLANLNQHSILFTPTLVLLTEMRLHRNSLLTEAATEGKRYTVSFDHTTLSAQVTFSSRYSDCVNTQSQDYSDAKGLISEKNALLSCLPPITLLNKDQEEIPVLKNAQAAVDQAQKEAEDFYDEIAKIAPLSLEKKIELVSQELTIKRNILIAKIEKIQATELLLSTVESNEDLIYKFEENLILFQGDKRHFDPTVFQSLSADLRQEQQSYMRQLRKILTENSLKLSALKLYEQQIQQEPLLANLEDLAIAKNLALLAAAAKKEELDILRASHQPSNETVEILTLIEAEACKVAYEESARLKASFENEQKKLFEKLCLHAFNLCLLIDEHENMELLSSQSYNLKEAYRNIHREGKVTYFLGAINSLISDISELEKKSQLDTEIATDLLELNTAFKQYNDNLASIMILPDKLAELPLDEPEAREILNPTVSAKVELHTTGQFKLNADKTAEITLADSKLIIHDQQGDLLSTVFPEVLQNEFCNMLKNTPEGLKIEDLEQYNLTTVQLMEVVNSLNFAALPIENQTLLFNYFIKRLEQRAAITLPTLSIKNSDVLTDSILTRILQKTGSGLTELRLENCPAITALPIHKKQKNILSGLTSLTIHYLHNLEQVTLELPNLTMLDFTPPPRLRNVAIGNNAFGVSDVNKRFYAHVDSEKWTKARNNLPPQILSIPEVYALCQVFNHYHEGNRFDRIASLEKIVSLLDEAAKRNDQLAGHAAAQLRIVFFRYRAMNPRQVLCSEQDQGLATINELITNPAQRPDLDIKWIDIHKMDINPEQINILRDLGVRLYLSQKQREMMKSYDQQRYFAAQQDHLLVTSPASASSVPEVTSPSSNATVQEATSSTLPPSSEGSVILKDQPRFFKSHSASDLNEMKNPPRLPHERRSSLK